MFRELLESNGVFEHNVKLIAYINDYQRAFAEYSCKEFKKNLVEQACLQYCIENGVKLEWLGKCELTHEDNNQINVFIREKGIDFEYDYASKLISYIGEVLDDIKILKLLCAIYAHDIKII